MAIGRAYCFFKSTCAEAGVANAFMTTALKSKKQAWKPDFEPLIEGKIRFRICEVVDVKEGARIIGNDGQQLIPEARKWQCEGANYFMMLSMEGSTNENAADELQSVLVAIPKVVFEGTIIEKAGNTKAAIYFMPDNGSSHTCRIIED